MRVFKFLRCDFGLEAIQKRRLKISTLESTNDPFEFLPFDLSKRGHRWATEQTRKHIGADKGMLCFSRHWNNPVIWSHYADSHKGICLEFEVADTLANPVNYIREPLPFDDPPTIETVRRMLLTKFDDWSYESEIRLWTTTETKDGELFFMNLDHNLVLQKVLLGVGCPLTEPQIDTAVGPYTNPVIIERVRRSSNKFEMEIDDQTYRGPDRYEENATELSRFFDGAKVIHSELGRNELCWCGSGKKYKRCHGAR